MEVYNNIKSRKKLEINMKIKVIKLFVFYCLIFIGLSKNIYAEELTNEACVDLQKHKWKT